MREMYCGRVCMPVYFATTLLVSYVLLMSSKSPGEG